MAIHKRDNGFPPVSGVAVASDRASLLRRRRTAGRWPGHPVNQAFNLDISGLRFSAAFRRAPSVSISIGLTTKP